MCKGSTGNGLLYAAKEVPYKDYFPHLTLTIARKGHWVIGSNYCASHPRRFCAVGDVVAQRYDVLCDWLWDACHMAGYVEDPTAKNFVAKKACTIVFSKAWGSFHKTSDNQPIHEFGYPFGDSIPGLYCVAWLGQGHARKCQSKDFCEKERYELCSVGWKFAAETFGKRRKRDNSLVMRLLPDSHERLASRNPSILCQKHGGACTMY